ncbi:hypothetical protein [Actinoplanes sp. NPDC026619]|uniref:hypothetical protein n=1 Tax=Actinoplanes sp. NPDC026619 TaxID=3155798 RepID=UPI0033DE2BC3
MTRPVALAVAAVLLLLTAGCGTTRSSGTTAQPAASSQHMPLPEDDNEDLSPAASTAPTDEALLAAQTFVRQWARPSVEQAAWYAGVQPWATPPYAQLLADTDPANVPAHAVTGAPDPVSSTTAVLVADVPTDAGKIRVTVVNTGGRWLVAAARPTATP